MCTGPIRWLAATLMLGAFFADAAPTIIDARSYHLRSGTSPEWQQFAESKPFGNQLQLRFQSKRNPTDAALFIRQEDVKLDWPVELNGRKLKSLFLMEAPIVWTLAVPAGTLRDGPNTLTITPPLENDDIVVGPFHLDMQPPAKALGATVQVQVTDAGAGLPCRITIADATGALAAVQNAGTNQLAIRPGVAYTANGQAQLGLLAGEYTIYASRGFEYSLATQHVALAQGERKRLNLKIHREVLTPGLVACDTHIHTWTHAKHGDATIEERMLTLAGEGIELPISTEHNMLVDFVEPAKRVGVEQYFTPVIGCEVTTKAGHFNVFPIKSGSSPPDHRLTDWPKLMQSIRSTPGVQVAVLNHPRDVHSGFIPFAETNLNPLSGENLRGFEFSFDAVELINSGALRSDLMQTYRNWFALLNYGYRIAGVAASDSHDVSRFIVGQGRTYIRCADEDAGQLNVDQAMKSLREGRASMSLGLLTQLEVDGRFHEGDLASVSGENIQVKVSVLRPSWIIVDRIELYANGLKVQEILGPTNSREFSWTLRRPTHDVHLIAIASGPGITSPHWAIPKPYQPSSLVWEPRVLGSSNPVWLDADSDGEFTPARGYAKRIIQKAGSDPGALVVALKEYDEAVAIQAANLWRGAGGDLRSPQFKAGLAQAEPNIRDAINDYISTLGFQRVRTPNR